MKTSVRECCAGVPEFYRPSRHLTIRESTAAERQSIGLFWATGKIMRARRYLVVDADDPTVWLGAFGMADGGRSKAEAVFWAERWASKNDGHFIRPVGWEKVIGALPERKS